MSSVFTPFHPFCEDYLIRLMRDNDCFDEVVSCLRELINDVTHECSLEVSLCCCSLSFLCIYLLDIWSEASCVN